MEITIVERKSDLDLTEAPIYKSAAFSDVAHEIIVQFKTAAYILNFGKDTATSCVSYFIERVLVKMGETPQCYWSDRFTLHATLGNGWTIAALQKVTLRSGAVRTTASSIITSGGYKLLQERRPAPLLREIYFAKSGGAILIRFDSSIGCWEGLSDDASTTSCSTVVHNANHLLGKDARCTWVKSCLLQIILGFGATLRATKDVSACGSCECNSCVPRAAYEQAGSFDALCRSPSHQCADPQCYCKDLSTSNLCPDGLSLQLLPGAVKAIRFGLLSSEGCMHVQYPDVVFVPKSIITAPRNFPVCSSLVVSGTDSETSGGGRDQFFWRVVAFNTEGGGLKSVPNAVRAVIAQANANNADILEFSANVFEFGRYRFSLQIANFLTLSVSSSDNTTVSGSASPVALSAQQIHYHDITASYIPLPQLTIVGLSNSIVKSKDRVVLRAKATPALCAPDQSLVYSWYQVQGDLNWETVQRNQKGNYDLTLPVLVIPPNMLTKGRDYIFRVSAYARSTPTLTNYENVIVRVASGVTVAGLDSYHRTCGIDDSLSINAVDYSYHEDDLSAVLNYYWTCVYVKGGDNRPCNAMKYSSGPSSGMLTLPRNSFAAKDQIVFTVDVSLVADPSDVASVNMTVNIVPGLTPVVQIKQGSRLVVNPEDKLSLFGNVQWNPSTTNRTLVWTETSGSLDLLAETQKVYFSALNRPHLVVRPYLLVPGRQYLFVLTAVGEKTNGSATVLVAVNRPPRGGFFQVTPTWGNGLQTEFSFALGSWADDESNYPLSYSFYVSNTNAGEGSNRSDTVQRTKLYPLSVSNVESSRQLFRLPAGKIENQYKIYPIAHVCDSLGACTVCHMKRDGSKVELTVNPLSPVETTAAIQNSVDRQHPSIGDTAVIGIAAEMLYPTPCLLPNSESNDLCQAAIVERRVEAENLLNLLIASEAITLASPIALEQQSLALAEISAFADKAPSTFVYKLIEHGNRIVDSAFSSGFSLSPASIVGLHAMFESLVDAATQNNTSQLVNQSWSVGQEVSGGIERAVSNALLDHVVGEDPLIVSGRKLSVYGKVDSLIHMPWVPLEFVDLHVGAIGFSLPPTMEGIDSTALQFVAVAQSFDRRSSSRLNSNPNRVVTKMVTELNLYDMQANKILLENLKEPIGLALPALNARFDAMQCFFWDESTNEWSQNGLYVQQLDRSNATDVSTVGCATTHLTSFSLEANQFDVSNQPNSIQGNYTEQEQLIFIFDASNIPVAGIVFGMSIFYVLVLVGIRIHETQFANNEFAIASMERFLNTGSTGWLPLASEERRSVSSLFKSYLATVAHQHPIIGWLRPSSQLGMPRLCYVLVLWNTTSVMFFVASASIGGAELYETAMLPLGWYYSMCGFVMVCALQTIVSHLLTWKSKQIMGKSSRSSCVCSSFFCCCSSSKNFAIVQSRKGTTLSKVPHHLWVDFERLRARCITYVNYVRAVASNDGDAAGVRAASVVLKSRGLTSNMASYERYVVRTAQEQGYPYPRSLFESVLVLQAAWRAYVVKTNLHAFLVYTRKNTKTSTSNNGKKIQTAEKEHGKNPTQKKQSTQNHDELAKMQQQHRVQRKFRQAALVLQTCVSISGSVLIVVGVSELFDVLHRQYAQATVGLGFFLIAVMSLGSFTLKFCNGYHLGMYVATAVASFSSTCLLLLATTNAGSADGTTLAVVRFEWGEMYTAATADASSVAARQQLVQWQDMYSCCGVQDVHDQNTMAVQPCALNVTIGCELSLATQVQSDLYWIQLALAMSTGIQLCMGVVCLVLATTQLDFRGFESQAVVESMEKDSIQMVQAFSRGKSPSDVATAELFTGLTAPTTYQAANMIQNYARVYLAKRRSYRKQEYDRIVGVETNTLQSVLNGTLLTALILSAVVLDVLTVAMALKLDGLRATRWRQSMELSCALLFGLFIPLVGVVTLMSDARWKGWLKVRCVVWHEV